MKQIIYTTTLLLIMLFAFACQNDNQENSPYPDGSEMKPNQYFNYISDLNGIIHSKAKVFSEALKTKNDSIMRNALSEMKVVVDSAQTLVANLKPYEDDAQLRKAALETFDFYIKAIDDKYGVLINIINKSKIGLDDSDKKLFMETTGFIKQHEAVHVKAFSEAMEKFIAKYAPVEEKSDETEKSDSE